jgi:hypothetical protein
MDSATWCRTPAAASAVRRLRPEVSKNSRTALSSNDGELARSMTTCAPARAPLSPSPGHSVDAACGRGGNDLVAAVAQNGDGLRADQAGAADDDDLHDVLSFQMAGRHSDASAITLTASRRPWPSRSSRSQPRNSARRGRRAWRVRPRPDGSGCDASRIGQHWSRSGRCPPVWDQGLLCRSD